MLCQLAHAASAARPHQRAHEHRPAVGARKHAGPAIHRCRLRAARCLADDGWAVLQARQACLAAAGGVRLAVHAAGLASGPAGRLLRRWPAVACRVGQPGLCEPGFGGGRVRAVLHGGCGEMSAWVEARRTKAWQQLQQPLHTGRSLPCKGLVPPAAAGCHSKQALTTPMKLPSAAAAARASTNRQLPAPSGQVWLSASHQRVASVGSGVPQSPMPSCASSPRLPTTCGVASVRGCRRVLLGHWTLFTPAVTAAAGIAPPAHRPHPLWLSPARSPPLPSAARPAGSRASVHRCRSPAPATGSITLQQLLPPTAGAQVLHGRRPGGRTPARSCAAVRRCPQLPAIVRGSGRRCSECRAPARVKVIGDRTITGLQRLCGALELFE